MHATVRVGYLSTQKTGRADEVGEDGMEGRMTVLRCTTLGVAGRLLLGMAGVGAYLVYLGA